MANADPVAVVTGGAAGIGAASGLAFAEAGYRVVLVDVDGEAAEETAAGLRAGGHDAAALRCDVAEPGTVLTYVIQFRNMGNTPIGAVSIVDSLLPRLSYVAGSAHPVLEDAVAALR